MDINRQSELNSDFDGVLDLQELSGQAQLTNGSDIPETEIYNSIDGKKKKGKKKSKIGGGIRGFLQNRRDIKNRKLDIREKRVEGSAAAKNMRANAKQTQAKSQIIAAKAAGKGDNNASISAALNQPVSSPTTSKGLSTGALVGIVGGSLLLLGVGAYFLLRKHK